MTKSQERKKEIVKHKSLKNQRKRERKGKEVGEEAKSCL